MTEKQISYFEKAYETGNIARASEQLYVSRSVISRSIQELEEEFGVVLFTRSKAGIIPTEAGKLLHSTVLQLSSCVNSLANRFREIGSTSQQRVLRVGVTPTNSRVICNLLFGPFRQAFPDVQLHVVEREHFDMIGFLSGCTVDVVVLPGQHADLTIFSTYPLWEVSIVLATHKNSPLAKKDKLGVMDLAYVPLAFLANPLPSVERILKASLEAAGQTPNIAVCCSNIHVLRDLTQQGRVSTFLPDDLIRDWTDVVGVPLDFSSNVAAHKLAWNKAVPLSSAACDFIEFCKVYFSEKKEAPEASREQSVPSLSSNFFAELLDLPACKSKGYCDGCGRCEH